MRQAIIWTSADPIYWRIYAALGEMSYCEVDIVNDGKYNTPTIWSVH